MQVLAMFNKAVRKLSGQLKRLAEREAEASMASRGDTRRAKKAAAGMAATGTTLGSDLAEGASDALKGLQAKGGAAGKGKAFSKTSALALELEADAELMQYAVQGADEAWERALGGSKPPASVSLQKAAPSPAAMAKGGGSRSGAGGTGVERILAEAQTEAEATRQASKKKRARILGGGFNELKSESGSAKKRKGAVKPEGKYKNK
jgi:hypothetical protein